MDRYILEIPNAFPEELCDEIIKRFELDNRKSKGMVHYDENTSFVDETNKKSTDLFISDKSGWEDIDSKLFNHLSICLNKYLSHLDLSFKDKNKIKHVYSSFFNNSNIISSGFDIQKINFGDSYTWHHDDNDERCTKVSKLLFNCLLYLNTLHEGEGGETEFIDGTKIRPEIGKMVIFPTSWVFLHCGNEVKAKHKYICCSTICIK